MNQNKQFAKFLFAITLSVAIAVGMLQAQQPLDRSKVPPPGKPAELRVPTWTKTVLSNGATLIVSRRNELPLVSFSITFQGGANQFEPVGRRGLSAITSAMLNEGTTSKTGDQLSDALQLLGTNVGANIRDEEGSIGFLSTNAKFERTLAILTDMMLNPTFPQAALDRLRGRTLINLTQAKDQPATIGAAVFAKTLFGNDHPYGQRPTESSIKAITRDDVVALHKSYFQPGRAIITVVGDVNPATIKGTIERAFAAWAKAGDKPSFDYPKLPESKPSTIYLVDKPGAAQSIFAIGLPGPPRNTPDYFALQVLNHILGGHFQSRLNYNIREQHGYSYGVNSAFGYGRGPGAFRAGGAIVSDKTDLALIEFMKELRGIVGERPITDDELKGAKDAMIQGLPRNFGSVGAIGNSITTLTVQGLPDNYYQSYSKAVSAITRDDLMRVAKQYIDLKHLAIVIVGDRSKVEGPLKATGIAPITLLDVEGNPVSSDSSSSNRPGN
jgi:zinc protease